MRTLARIVIWAAAIFVAVFVIAAGVLYFLYPKEKLIAALVPRAEQALGLKVTLRDAGISFWPPFGVTLEGLTVANPPGFKESHLLTAEYARADLALISSLTGTLAFDEMELRGVFFAYESLNDTLSNISALLAGPSRGLIPIADFDLQNLRVHYIDHQDTTALLLDSVSVRAHLAASSMAFDAEFDVPHWVWYSEGDSISSRDPVNLSLKGSYAAAEKRLNLDEFSGSLAGVPLKGSIKMDMGGPKTALDGNVEIGPADLQDIQAQLPEARRAAFAAFKIEGHLAGQFKLNGVVGEQSLPISGEVVWSDGRVERNGSELMRFAALTVPVNANGLSVASQDAVVLGGPAKISGSAQGIPPERADVSLSGKLALAQLAKMTKKETGLSGQVEYAFSGRGPVKDFKQWAVQANLRVDNAEVTEAGREKISLPQAVLAYNGSRLEIDELHAVSGRTRLNLSGHVSGLEWQEFMADSVVLQPDVRLSVSTPYCDIDQFFPALAPDTARPADTSATPPLPAMTAVVDVAADTLIVGGAEWRRMRGTIRYANNVLSIDTLHGIVYGGKAALRGSVDLTQPKAPQYHLSAQADSVRVDQVLGRFTRLGVYIRGETNLSAKVEGRGTEMRDLVNQLSVAGAALVFNAKLVNLDAAASVTSLIGIETRDSIPFRSRQNQFVIEAGRVRFEDFAFSALDSDWKLAGSAGLDGSLDYDLDVTLSDGISSQFKVPAALAQNFSTELLAGGDPVSLLKNDQGRVELYLQLSGDYKKPGVKFDWERMLPAIKQRAQTRLTDKAKKTLEDKAKEGLQNLLGKPK